MWVRFETGYAPNPKPARLLHCLHRVFLATSGKQCVNNLKSDFPDSWQWMSGDFINYFTCKNEIILMGALVWMEVVEALTLTYLTRTAALCLTGEVQITAFAFKTLLSIDRCGKIGSSMVFVMICCSATGFSVFPQRHHYTTPTPEPVSWSPPQSAISSHLLTTAV